MPKNLEEEKIKFFESNHEYNPQFIYENENLTKKYLKQFYSEKNKGPDGTPLANDEYMKIATKILKSWLKDFKSETNYLQTEGEILTKEETERIINEYLKELEIEKLITLNFTKNIVAPTSISHDTK